MQWVDRHRARKDGLEVLRNGRRNAPKRCALALSNEIHEFAARLRRECRAKGRKLPQRHAERIDLAPRVVAPRELLGGHVLQRAQHVARVREPVLLQSFREPEVRDPDMAVAIEQQVGRLHVAMERAMLVRMVQSIRDIGTDPGSQPEAVAQRLRTLRLRLLPQPFDHCVESLPVDELHGVEVQPIGLAAVEHRHDVRVVQSRGGLRFAPEAFELVAGQEARLRHHLERNAAIEGLLHRLEHDTHAATTDFANDAILAEALQLRQPQPAAAGCRRLAIALCAFEHQQRLAEVAQFCAALGMLRCKTLWSDRLTASHCGEECLAQHVERVALVVRWIALEVAHGCAKPPSSPLSLVNART